MSFIRDLFSLGEVLGDIAFNNISVKDSESFIAFESDIKYGSDECCVCDLYYRTDREFFPVIVNIHGGGFIGGDKTYRRGLCKWYASLGFFVININYGLAPKYVYPHQATQIAQVMTFIQKIQEKYNRLDTDHIIVGGDSAGAFYAALLALIANCEKMKIRLPSIDCPFKVAGLLLNCGLYDVESARKRKLPFHVIDNLLEAVTGHTSENFATYPHKDLCSLFDFMDSSFPPSFIIWAEKDILCGDQGQLLLKVLHGLDVYAECYHSKDWLNNHCFSLVWASPTTAKINKQLVEFLDKLVLGTLDLSEVKDSVGISLVEATKEQVAFVREESAKRKTVREATAKTRAARKDIAKPIVGQKGIAKPKATPKDATKTKSVKTDIDVVKTKSIKTNAINAKKIQNKSDSANSANQKPVKKDHLLKKIGEIKNKK